MKLIFIFFILVCELTYGQNKKPIEFIDYDVEWMHEPWVDSISVYDQVFDIVREPIITEEYIITVYTNFLPSPFGFLVEKINLNTGELIWEYNEFSEEQYTRKVVNDVYLIGDTLELLLFEESSTIYNPTYPRWDSCHVALLRLNVNTGENIDYIQTDHSDSLNVVFDKGFFTFSKNIISNSGNGYNIVKTMERVKDDSIRYEDFISIDLDYNGNLVKSDTLILSFPSFQTTTDRNFPFNERRFISHVESPFFATLDLQYFSSLILMDYDLHSFDSIQLQQHFNYDSLVSISMNFYDDEKFLIEVAGDFSFDFDYQQKYFLFDYQGNLLNKHENKIDLASRGEFILAYGYDENNNILGIGEYQEFSKDSTTHLYFWKTNSNNTIDTLLDLSIKDSDIDVFPLKAYITPDNDLLVYYTYLQPSYPPEFNGFQAPKWYFWIKVDGNDLGLKTNTSDLSLETSRFKIFPNPVDNYLNIRFDKVRNGYLTISSIVDTVKQIDFNNRRELKVNLSNYNYGHYIISLYDDEGKIIQSEIFIKA